MVQKLMFFSPVRRGGGGGGGRGRGHYFRSSTVIDFSQARK